VSGLLPNAISIVSALIATFAGFQAHRAARLSSFHPARTLAPRRSLRGLLFGAGPNDAAGPADIANKFDGVDGATGRALQYRLYAWGYEAHAFGLPVDYAYPEGQNVSASMGDGVTSLAKLFGRKKTLIDGNQYDSWDMLVASAKAALRTYPDLMSNEVLSKNYGKQIPLTAEQAELADKPQAFPFMHPGGSDDE
jgi:hypothetical protein